MSCAEDAMMFMAKCPVRVTRWNVSPDDAYELARELALQDGNRAVTLGDVVETLKGVMRGEAYVVGIPVRVYEQR